MSFAVASHPPAVTAKCTRRHARSTVTRRPTAQPNSALASVKGGATVTWATFRGIEIRCAAAAGEGDASTEDSSQEDGPKVEVVPDTEDTTVTSEAGSLIAPLLEQLQAALDGDDVNGVLADVLPNLKSEIEAVEESAGNAQAANVGLEDQVGALKDQYLRLNADFDNFRKRTEKEKAQLSETSKAKFMEAMLPVVDNFELAKQNVKTESEEAEKVNSSYQALYKQLMEILSTQGLTAVDGVGAQFDPNMHEAIMREETSDAEDDTILEEFRKGYKVGDRLIRPAMVKVAVAVTSEGADKSAAEEEIKEEA